MQGQMQIVVFHCFAYTCCTASFQPFCRMSAIRYNVLSDRAFPQVCYRTLVGRKDSGFLGISVVCGVVFLPKRVLDNRIDHRTRELLQNTHLIRLKKCRTIGNIRLEKCNKSVLFAQKSVKLYALYLFLALILMSQSSLDYTLSNIIAIINQ